MHQARQNINIVNSKVDTISDKRRFAHEAMATTFEIIIQHQSSPSKGRDEDRRYAQQAACAAFDELDRLEQELSRFIENSDISRINNLAAKQSLRLGLPAFECLQLCSRIHAKTSGAFDITIGLLMDCWLNPASRRGGVNEDKTMRKPTQVELNFARQHTGLHQLSLDEAEHTVQLLSDPVKIDLGGFGKGYAVDQMAKLLRDWSIDTALIHSGGSSVLGLGCPPEANGWHVTLSNPCNRRQTLARLYLHDRALSGSGLQKGRLIIDPRTARPVEVNIAAWACAPTAATADALSTAFMAMSSDEVEQYCLSHSDVLAMLVTKGDTKAEENTCTCGYASAGRILHFGSWKQGDLLK